MPRFTLEGEMHSSLPNASTVTRSPPEQERLTPGKRVHLAPRRVRVFPAPEEAQDSLSSSQL